MRKLLVFLLSIIFRKSVLHTENLEKDGHIALFNALTFFDAFLLCLIFGNKYHLVLRKEFEKYDHIYKIFFKTTYVDFYTIEVSELSEILLANKYIIMFAANRHWHDKEIKDIFEKIAFIANANNIPINPIIIKRKKTLLLQTEKRYSEKFSIKINICQRVNFSKINYSKLIKKSDASIRRRALGNELFDAFSRNYFYNCDFEQNIWESVLLARKRFGGKSKIVSDLLTAETNYDTIILRSIILGKYFKNICDKQEHVGIFLPNSIGFLYCFLSLSSIGTVPALLNYSAGMNILRDACKVARIKKIVTSKRFIEQAVLQKSIELFESLDIEIIYLEDVKEKVGTREKLFGILNFIFSPNIAKNIDPDDPAFILFTSGSESMPKAVVLSHKNVRANNHQAISMVNIRQDDIIFNAMPVFHSMGLCVGTLLPIFFGVKCFYYPSPLHYRIIPENIKKIKATLMFGTDTFLRGYANFATAEHFKNIRYALVGAEKLLYETREIYKNKYNVDIIEGYGVTEASPIISINSQIYNYEGTIGRFVPGVNYNIEKIEGIDSGGRLYINGPNVMKGYINPETGLIDKLSDKGHDTGDIIDFNEEGFVKILGRAKRFAKISGEMVSLTSIEQFITNNFPAKNHAIISIPCKRKGEKLILFTEDETLNSSILSTKAKKHGFSNLSIPKEVVHVAEIPLLSTGKVDYLNLKLGATEYSS